MLAQKAAASTGAVPVFADNSPTPDSDPRECPASNEGARQNQRRLAPRSSNQFRVGPPFSESTLGFRLITSENKQAVPQISARLDRGFDLIEGEWIGYKRNYFTLVAAFRFDDFAPDVLAKESFWYVDSTGQRQKVLAFKISLTSVCLEDSSTAVTLVQHTAKRDRGPQSSPPLYYAVPGELPAHSTMKSVANIRNGNKIDRCNRLFYLSREDHQSAIDANPDCVLATYPRDCEISLVARYERIQFSSAGCGNRKSASTNNKHYVLVVQLLGMTESDQNVLLASSQSPPLIVRGRSPSNYPLSDKKEVKSERPEGIGGKTNITNLISHERNEAENDVENQASQKKRKFKPATKPNRTALSFNQNILNSYTAEALDPVLLESRQQERVQPGLKYGPPPLKIPRLLPPLDERLFFGDYGFAPPVPLNSGYLIAQESPFPFLEDSPTMQNSFSFVNDFEPMNINHTPFQSSQDQLNRAMDEFEDTRIELEDFLEANQANSYDCYSSLPVPISFPETIRTSTPLQLRVTERPVAMQPNLIRNLHPPVARCKHGFKQRDNTHQPAYQDQRLYTYADLDDSTISDSSFRAFKKKLNSYKPRLWNQSPQPPSLRSSPLTMLSSDHDALMLQEAQESSENDKEMK